tara:strand:- start:635 stop:1579 length:945 start_codon:yes stop_codon:yes gene_type:complete
VKLSTKTELISAERAVRQLFQGEHLLGCAWVLRCGVLALAAILIVPHVSAEGRSDDTVKVIAESGFLDDTEGVKPVRGASYEMSAPKISLPFPKNAIVVIYMHGTQNPRSRSSCGAWWNDVPATLKNLAKKENLHLYYLCSKATDPPGRDHGSWIFERVKEISAVLDQLTDTGVPPQRIFLSGHSAGGWASLMAMSMVDRKFNAAIVFAPAFAGPRAEEGVYPIWRGEIRPKHVTKMTSFDTVRALVFAYDNDPYNRTAELKFLTNRYPDSVEMVSSTCMISLPLTGHLTHLKDCEAEATERTIIRYIEARLSN